MDIKDLRTEPALSERSNDGNANYAHSGPSFPSTDKNKSYHDIGANALPKVDVPTTRPCAVIGPDRIIPPQAANDPYIKRGHVEPWQFTRPPEYPHKITEYQHVSRNISPRQTFQENMQRIMVPPRSLKLPEDTNFSAEKNVPVSKNITKAGMPNEAKYCDVPYSVNLLTNEQKSARSSEHSVSYVNPTIVRSLPHAWPPAGVNVRPPHPYGAPDPYHYPDYTNCAAPRAAPVIRPLRTGLEDPTHMYHDPYRGGNIRYEPYPTLKERNPMSRYEYFGNYSNPYPPLYTSHKYDVQKLPTSNTTLPHQPYPGYPQVPLKYLREPPKDGYQRATNPQANFNVPYNQNAYPNYGSVPGNCLQSKLYTYPPDSTFNAAPNAKTLYDMNSKPYVKHNDNIQPKHFPTHENLYLNEVPRSHMKPPMGIPGYQSVNMHPLPPYPYYRKESMPLRSYDYSAQYKHNDPSYNTQMSRIPTQFSPNIISPVESNASTDNHGFAVSPEDCGYVSQSSTTSVRSTDSMYRVYDPRYGHINRASPITSRLEYDSKTTCNKDKKGIDVRQFLQMWNEGEDEHSESHPNKDKVVQSTANDGKQYEVVSNQDQLYVLGLVNVPSEELGKYEHIQKVSKLPENIKGYTSIDLLNQFEEAIESSNINDFPVGSTDTKVIQVSTKSNVLSKGPNLASPNLPTRPLSPLDVEAKISQSVIHKEVGCNFEIRPCSPKLFNVEAAAPAQTLLEERAIEKVCNRHVVKSPQVLSNIGDNSSNCHIIKRQDRRRSLNRESNTNNPCCKMVKSQYINEVVEEIEKSNYTIQDLESNSGVCLASLPRLDNDIELSFPEVNQQFINANKAETVITTPCNSLPLMETSNSEIAIATESNEMKCLNSYPFSPSSKEVSKLSKYRKVRGNKESQQSTQVIRTDSVIIKNPENNGNISELKQPLISNSNLAEEPINNLCEQAPMNLAINNHQPGSGTATISSNFNKFCDIPPKNNIQDISENIAINLSFNSKTEHTDENLIKKLDLRKSHKIMNGKESLEPDGAFHFSRCRRRNSESVPEDSLVTASNNQNDKDFSKTHESEEKINQSLNITIPQCEKEISSENHMRSSPKMSSEKNSGKSKDLEVTNDDVRRNQGNSYDGSSNSKVRVIYNISEPKTGYKSNDDPSLYQILEDGVGDTLATLLSPLSDDSINYVSQDSFINRDENGLIDSSSEYENEENVSVSSKPCDSNSDKTMSVQEQCSESFGKILIGMTKTQDLDKASNKEEADTGTKLNSTPDPFSDAIKSNAKSFENVPRANISKPEDSGKTASTSELANKGALTSKSNEYSNFIGTDVTSRKTILAIQSKHHNTEPDHTASKSVVASDYCLHSITSQLKPFENVPPAETSFSDDSDRTNNKQAVGNTDNSNINSFKIVSKSNTSEPDISVKTTNLPEVKTEISFTLPSAECLKPIQTDMTTLEVYRTKTSKPKDSNVTACISEEVTDTAVTITSDQYSNYIQSDPKPSEHIQADKPDHYSDSIKSKLTPFENTSQTDTSKPDNSETTNLPQGIANTVVSLTSDQCSNSIKSTLSLTQNFSRANIPKLDNIDKTTSIPQEASDTAVLLTSGLCSNSNNLEPTLFENVSGTDIPYNSNESGRTPQGPADTGVPLTSDHCSNSMKSKLAPIENVSCADIPQLDNFDERNVPQGVTDAAVSLTSDQCSSSFESKLSLVENFSCTNIPELDNLVKTTSIPQEASDTAILLTSNQCSNSNNSEQTLSENVSGTDIPDNSNEAGRTPQRPADTGVPLTSDHCPNSINSELAPIENVSRANISKPDKFEERNIPQGVTNAAVSLTPDQCSISYASKLSPIENFSCTNIPDLYNLDKTTSIPQEASDTGILLTTGQCSSPKKSEITLFKNISGNDIPDYSNESARIPQEPADKGVPLVSDPNSIKSKLAPIENDSLADISKHGKSDDTAIIPELATVAHSSSSNKTDVKPLEQVSRSDSSKPDDPDSIVSKPEVESGTTFIYSRIKCSNYVESEFKSFRNDIQEETSTSNESDSSDSKLEEAMDTAFTTTSNECLNSVEKTSVSNESDSTDSKLEVAMSTAFTSTSEECSNSVESEINLFENVSQTNIPKSDDSNKTMSSPGVINNNSFTLKSDEYTNSIEADVKSLEKYFHGDTSKSDGSKDIARITEVAGDNTFILTSDPSTNHLENVEYEASKEIAGILEMSTDDTKTSEKHFNLKKIGAEMPVGISTADVLNCNDSNIIEVTPKLLTDTKLNLQSDQCSNSIESFVKMFDRVSHDISKANDLDEPDTPFTSSFDQCSNSVESDVQSLENVLRANIPVSFHCDEHKMGTRTSDKCPSSIELDVKSLDKAQSILNNSPNSNTFNVIRHDDCSSKQSLAIDDTKNHAKYIQSPDPSRKMCVDTLDIACSIISPHCSNTVRDKNSINEDIKIKHVPRNTPRETVEESSMNKNTCSSQYQIKYKKLHFCKKLFSPVYQNLMVFQEGITKSSKNISAIFYPTEYETKCYKIDTDLRVPKTDLKNVSKTIKETHLNEDLMLISYQTEIEPETVNHRYYKQFSSDNFTILEENLNTELNSDELNLTNDTKNYVKAEYVLKETLRVNDDKDNDTKKKNDVQNSEVNQDHRDNLLDVCIKTEVTIEKGNNSYSQNETMLDFKPSIKTDLLQCTPENTAKPQQHLENDTHEKTKSGENRSHCVHVKTVSEVLYDKEQHIDESLKLNNDIEPSCKYTTEEYQEHQFHDKSMNLDEYTTATKKICCENVRSDSRIVAYSDSSIESDYMEYNFMDSSETFGEQQEQPMANDGLDKQTRSNEIYKDNIISEDTIACKTFNKNIIETDETECIPTECFKIFHEEQRYLCDDVSQRKNKDKEIICYENVSKTDVAGSETLITDRPMNMSLEPIRTEPDQSTKTDFVCIAKENEQGGINNRTCKTSTLRAGRRTLKRSLSESALYYATENPKLEDIPNWVHRSSLWPNKRKRIEDGFEEDSNTISSENDCNIVQNRRNSISTFYHQDNVSFCILIDDNCIITEGDYEEEEAVCFADIQDENFNAAVNSHLISDNVVYHQPTTSFSRDDENIEFSKTISLDCTSEKEIEENWVEDVACVETVVSDDIVEDDDELYGDNRSPSPECEDVFDHTDKIKNIYGDEMCSNDIHLIKTLYSTPQMDVNKTLHDKESLVEFARQYKNDYAKDNMHSSNNISEATSEYIERQTDVNLNGSKAEPGLEKLQIKEFEDNIKSNNDHKTIECRPENLLELTCELTSKTVDTCRQQDDTIHSCEASLSEVTCLNEPSESTTYKRSSSSPEVSSTTSEDKKSGILLKITNYNGSRVSQINNADLDNTKRIRCKFTEVSDYLSGKGNSSKSRPLITKAAQKYIPPLKETIRDLKVKLFLPEDSLVKLKQLKVSKETPKLMSPKQLRAGKPTLNNNKIIPKKPKPKFEDVLKSIDEVQAQMRKERSKKVKKSVPKVIIKKTENGLYNTSSLNKETFNPDLTGRKWQPWVFIERNKFIDKMASKGKKRAVFCHRKNTYILAEHFQKYKSVGSTKIIISQPKSENVPPGPLRYTIKLKQSY